MKPQRKQRCFRQVQTLIQKQDNRNALEVEQKIRALKVELREINKDYNKKVYEILNEIFKLRCSQIKGYKFSNLQYERGIDMSYHQIRYFENYKNITPEVKELIKKDKINDSQVLDAIKRYPDLKDETLRNRFMEKLVNKELKTEDLKNLTTKVIIQKLRNDMPLCSEFTYNMWNKVEFIYTRCNTNLRLLKQDKKYIDKFRKSVENLYNLSKRI